jgi:hypothetical protein
MDSCGFSDCVRPLYAKGLCKGHYGQQRRGKPLTEIVAAAHRGKGCVFPGCGNPNHSHGLCAAHNRQKQLGVELRPVRPPRPTAEDGYHWCSTCQQFQPVESFGWDKTRDQPKRVCLDCAISSQAAYIERNREQVNLGRRLRKRGLSKEQFDEMFAAQGGRCAICKRDDQKVEIDHDHDNGQVRGLLCGACNKALGFLDDDPALFRAGIAYLKRRSR